MNYNHVCTKKKALIKGTRHGTPHVYNHKIIGSYIHRRVLDGKTFRVHLKQENFISGAPRRVTGAGIIIFRARHSAASMGGS